MKFTDVIAAIGILIVISLIIVPLNALLLDFFLIVNISVALMVLLMAIFTKEALEFSVFPPLLLILTLFRLALNISSTRLILSNNGEAGAVIKTFGGFVIGGNLAVGVIIFIIIVLIQFIVITKGSERVSEVAARFTLDAMPGKQMAIDADLNTGLINEQQAKARRLKIQREADFYGSMDGASKFVKGDAIVGIIITIINIVGGIIIGVLTSGLDISVVLQRYTLATVGEGLVCQLPALLISTATGIIVTRAASENNLGHDISEQLAAQPNILIVAGSMLFVLSFIPGLPKGSIFLLGAGLVTLGLILKNNIKKSEVVPENAGDEEAAEMRKPENVLSLLSFDPIEMELGYGLIALADAQQGGDLTDRVVMIRRQCAMDLGMVIPSIRLRDNIQLKTNEYVVKIRGNEVARGEVIPDCYLAMNSTDSKHVIKGIETIEPSFGLPALWITRTEREKAELYGYTIVDPPSVIATHLTEILKLHGHELLDRQQVQSLINNLHETQPALVDEVFPKLFSIGDLQKVLSNLLKESVSIRDMVTIVETMADYAPVTRNCDALTEFVRQRSRRTISRKHFKDKMAQVITLDPKLEQIIMEKLRQTDQGSFVALTPDQIHQVLGQLRTAIEDTLQTGVTPIVLTSPSVRPHFKKMTEQLAPDLTVLSYNEIEASIEIRAERMVGIQV